MIRRLIRFHFRHRLRWCHRIWKTSCRSIKSLYSRRRATVACSSNPYHYAFAGHPSPLNCFFSLLSGPLVYKCYSCISRSGSFAAHLCLYALTSLVVHPALQCAGFNHASSPICLFRLFLLIFLLLDVSFSPCVEFPVLRSSLFTTFLARCDTSWGGFHAIQ